MTRLLLTVWLNLPKDGPASNANVVAVPASAHSKGFLNGKDKQPPFPKRDEGEKKCAQHLALAVFPAAWDGECTTVRT